MINNLSCIQKENQSIEYIYAKRLSSDVRMYHFISTIYQKILTKVKQIEFHKQIALKTEFKQLLIHEIQHRLLPQCLFAHTQMNIRTYHNQHGSVGERSVFFFETLPQKSNAYFDIMFSAITNAIYQYKGDGLVNLYSVKEVDSRIDGLRKYRVKSTIASPHVYDVNILPEERALYDRENAIYPSRGENNVQLTSCEYTDRASILNAPVITGLSGDAYGIFKFLTLFLDLDETEFVLLRKALVAYMVSFHDHSLIEVIESINFVFEDPKFANKFKFDVMKFSLKLESNSDYQRAVAISFEDVMDYKVVIQKNCAQFLFSSPPIWFEKAIDSYFPNVKKSAKKDRTRTEVIHIFNSITDIQPGLLREVLYEDQHEWSLTTMESIVTIYCHSKFSHFPFKLVFADTLERQEAFDPTSEQIHFYVNLVKIFGLSSAQQSGLLLDYSQLAKHMPLADVPHWEKQVSGGRGSILSTKHLTPLLYIIWIMGAISSHQNIFLVRKNDAIGEKNIFSSKELLDKEKCRPTMLCFVVYMLHVFGYKVKNIKDHGVVFIPPIKPCETCSMNIFSKWDELIRLSAEELVPFINHLLT